jgi:hypothetical protein
MLNPKPDPEHVARVVAELPPLTDEQCQRIAGLLLAGGE